MSRSPFYEIAAFRVAFQSPRAASSSAGDREYTRSEASCFIPPARRRGGRGAGLVVGERPRLAAGVWARTRRSSSRGVLLSDPADRSGKNRGRGQATHTAASPRPAGRGASSIPEAAGRRSSARERQGGLWWPRRRRTTAAVPFLLHSGGGPSTYPRSFFFYSLAGTTTFLRGRCGAVLEEAAGLVRRIPGIDGRSAKAQETRS